MSNGIETIRELNASELDLVGGGLSVSANVGAKVNAAPELKAVSGLVGEVGSLATGLLGDVTGAAGGLLGGVLGAV